MTRDSDRPAGPARSISSLKDVARLAGVSTATVSRALNHPELLEPLTLLRVSEAIRKLRYLPHGAARALRSQRSRTVGAIVPSFEYALYARTTSALERVLDDRGYALLLASHHYDLRNEVRLTRALIERGVEALMFVGLDHDPELYVLLREFDRPYVLTWGVDPTGKHPSIGFNNRAATHSLTRHLIELGHRRFGLIGAPHEGNDRARERTAGVRAALAEHGLLLPEDRVRYGPIALDSGIRGMSSLLSMAHRPTAVIATNDVFAVGAMVACRQSGVAIPGDVSITGVDNTDLGATQTPGLTSVRTPIVEVGRSAAQFLLARLAGEAAVSRIELPFELVIRGSTGPAPKRATSSGRTAGRRATVG